MTDPHGHDAAYATMCSYLGLSARDVAEIGGFSDRFARDLLAGRKPFPQDLKVSLFKLFGDFRTIVKAMKQEVRDGETIFYIFRTNEQLRRSPLGRTWPSVGKSSGGFVGPYRAAAFEVFRWAGEDELKPVRLVFAETPSAD